MTKSRRVAAVTGALAAIAASSSALAGGTHLGNVGEGFRGFIVGVSLVLSVSFLIKSRRESRTKPTA